MDVGVTRGAEIMWHDDLLYKDEISVVQQGSISNTTAILRGNEANRGQPDEASIYSFWMFTLPPSPPTRRARPVQCPQPSRTLLDSGYDLASCPSLAFPNAAAPTPSSSPMWLMDQCRFSAKKNHELTLRPSDPPRAFFLAFALRVDSEPRSHHAFDRTGGIAVS